MTIVLLGETSRSPVQYFELGGGLEIRKDLVVTGAIKTYLQKCIVDVRRM